MLYINDTMSGSGFWLNVFNNLGFEKDTVLGFESVKIPIYEAIYMNQVMGARKRSIFKDDWRRGKGYSFIPIDKKNFISFPKSTSQVLVDDLILNSASSDNMINPMLTPSMNFVENRFPDFFESKEKYLLVRSFGGSGTGSKLDSIEEFLEKIEETEYNSTDFIFFVPPHHDSDNDYIGEPILEYFLSSYLRQKGYIVDKFNENLNGRDSKKHPDLFAIKLPEIQNKLIKNDLIDKGAYLCELELLNSYSNKEEVNEEVIMTIEVESSRKRRGAGGSQGVGQTREALKSGYYTEGMVFAPFIKDIERDAERYGIGFGTLDRDGTISVERHPNYSLGSNPELNQLGLYNKTYTTKKMIERIIKLTLLKNRPLIDILRFIPDVNSFYDLYLYMENLKTEEIIDSIK